MFRRPPGPAAGHRDLPIRAGERVAPLGRSGAGKSTLIGLIHAAAARDIALVPQAAALVRSLSVFHNVQTGRLDRRSTLHNLRTRVRPVRADVEAVRAVLARVDLADVLWARAGELPGGQQQRVSVARALDNGRPIRVGDESASALDRRQGAAILPLLDPIRAKLPPGYRIDTAGSVEESEKAQMSLAAVFPLMLMVTLTVVMLQVRSFATTFMVLATAPPGLVGAAPTLLLFNQPFGFNAILGLIALSTMVGAVVLARGVDDEALADELLKAARTTITG